jgi:ABC-2 type transport system ATP-binding protein
MADIVIRTRDLTRDFGIVRAVDSISLEVPSGSVFGFLGPNGSGKTTTIHLLLGLLEPTSGNAEVLGFDTRARADEIRDQSGALLEFAGLYERMSAADNLEFFGRIWKMPAQERRERSKELLTHIGLWDRRNEPIGKWSKGMKQKLAVARTLFHRPRLVFLDEPTAGLDPIAAAALREDILQLVRHEKATVFLTTHNLAEAEKLCGKVGVINKGKLVTAGSPDEMRSRAGKSRLEVTGRGLGERVIAILRSNPQVADVRAEDGRLLIDLYDDSASSQLIGLMVNAGAEIDEVRKGKASLEEAFLSLMEAEQ